MPIYDFTYKNRVERMNGKNKNHAYNKMKKIYPDEIPYKIDLVKGLEKEVKEEDIRRGKILGKRFT